VDVVLGAIDDSRHPANLADNATHVSEKIGSDSRVDRADAALCAEHHVNE